MLQRTEGPKGSTIVMSVATVATDMGQLNGVAGERKWVKCRNSMKIEDPENRGVIKGRKHGGP